MQSTIIDQYGRVCCPNCRAVDSFTAKRMPISLQCNGCGKRLKRGAAAWSPSQNADGSWRR